MKQRLVGIPLEVFLAESMSRPGERNYNISRYIVLDGKLDAEAWADAVQAALLDAGLVHHDYEISGQAAWCVSAPDRTYKIGSVDLRGVPDAMKQSLEAAAADTNRALPLRSKEAQVRAVLFSLGKFGNRERWIYYHRYHHILLDGYSGQELLLRRIADRYNARVRGSEPPPSPILGYEALVEEEIGYGASDECVADRAFWRDYLGEYLERTRNDRAKESERGSVPSLRRTCIARRSGRIPETIPIESITAAVMTTFYRAAGVPNQMVGMTFMRRKKGQSHRIISPMATVLPLWADVGGMQEHAAVAARVGEAIKQIKRHQYYGGERAVRDLGHHGRPGGLYLATVNFRIYGGRRQITFDGLTSTDRILAVGPVSGMMINVTATNERIQLDVESIYKVVHGIEFGVFAELMTDAILAALGDDYYPVEDDDS